MQLKQTLGDGFSLRKMGECVEWGAGLVCTFNDFKTLSCVSVIKIGCFLIKKINKNNNNNNTRIITFHYNYHWRLHNK